MVWFISFLYLIPRQNQTYEYTTYIHISANNVLLLSRSHPPPKFSYSIHNFPRESYSVGADTYLVDDTVEGGQRYFSETKIEALSRRNISNHADGYWLV